MNTLETERVSGLLENLKRLLASNDGYKVSLDRNFVEVGAILATIRTDKLWTVLGFKNFTEFMKSLSCRTQAFHAMGVFRDLSPTVSHDDLAAMGITKASVLRLLVKGGKPVTPELVAFAKHDTKEALEDVVHKELGLVEDDEPGKWFSYGGARLQDDEVEEFLRTVNVVVRESGMGGAEVSKWQDEPSNRKKQIMQLLCAEFLATYVPHHGP